MCHLHLFLSFSFSLVLSPLFFGCNVPSSSAVTWGAPEVLVMERSQSPSCQRKEPRTELRDPHTRPLSLKRTARLQPNVPVEVNINCTVKGDVAVVYKVMLRAMVVGEDFATSEGETAVPVL